MSIAVMMVSNTGAVAATDSQRVESNCDVRLDCNKTFSIGKWLIGAYTGLLEFAGRTVSEHISSIVLADQPLAGSQCLDTISANLRDTLLAVKPEEVVFQHRIVDILLVVRSTGFLNKKQIQTLRISPDATGTDLVIAKNVYSPWAIAGDEAAKASVEPQLHSLQKKIPGFTTYELDKEARKAITRGIAASGPLPRCPGVSACGGIPMVVSLSNSS